MCVYLCHATPTGWTVPINRRIRNKVTGTYDAYVGRIEILKLNPSTHQKKLQQQHQKMNNNNNLRHLVYRSNAKKNSSNSRNPIQSTIKLLSNSKKNKGEAMNKNTTYRWLWALNTEPKIIHQKSVTFWFNTRKNQNPGITENPIEEAILILTVWTIL